MDEAFYRVTSRFVVVTEDGRRYEVEETTRYMRVDLVGGETDTVRVDRHYRTTSGIRVCRLSNDFYGVYDPDVQAGTDAVIAKRR